MPTSPILNIGFKELRLHLISKKKKKSDVKLIFIKFGKFRQYEFFNAMEIDVCVKC